jgi:HAD superfamily hydrolase (TIGR01509 family)
VPLSSITQKLGILMPAKKTIKGVLFDMDGTLFGTEELWFQSEVKLMNRFGVSWTRADHAICVGGPMSRVTEYMLERLSHQIREKELFELEMQFIEREFALGQIPWQPGAEEIVLQAKSQNMKIALVTASNAHLVRLVGAQIDLDIFDAIVCGDDVSSPKPDPEAYELGLKNLHLEPEQAFAIEDSNSGAKSALSAGLQVVCPPSHTITIEDSRLHLIDSLAGYSLTDLLSLIQGEL